MFRQTPALDVLGEFACIDGIQRLWRDMECGDQLDIQVYVRGFREGVRFALCSTRKIEYGTEMKSRQD